MYPKYHISISSFAEQNFLKYLSALVSTSFTFMPLLSVILFLPPGYQCICSCGQCGMKLWLNSVSTTQGLPPYLTFQHLTWSTTSFHDILVSRFSLYLFGYSSVLRSSFVSPYSLIFFFLKFVHLSNLYAKCGAQTHNPKIKSHILYWLS